VEEDKVDSRFGAQLDRDNIALVLYLDIDCPDSISDLIRPKM